MRIDTTINRDSIAFAIKSLCSDSKVIDCSSSSKVVDFKTKEINLKKFYKSVEHDLVMLSIQRTNGKLTATFTGPSEFIMFGCDEETITESDIANTILKLFSEGCTLYETVLDVTYIITSVRIHNDKDLFVTLYARDISDADDNVIPITIGDGGMLATTGSLVFVGTKLFDMKR